MRNYMPLPKRREPHQRKKPAPMKNLPIVLVALHVWIKRRPRILDQHTRIQPRLQRDIRLLINRIRPNRLGRQMRQIDAHDVVRMPGNQRRLPPLIQDVIRGRNYLRQIQIPLPCIMNSRKRPNIDHVPS